jgi:hypothetical protein
MSKRDKQRQPERRGAGLSSLRPRLDQLLRSEVVSQAEHGNLYEDLDRLTSGIKPTVFLPTIVAAAIHAPEAAQARLDELLPDWLSARGHLATLGGLLVQQSLDDAQQQRVLAWLASAGADTGELVAELEQWDAFYAAFYAGNPMQASLMIFWYTSRRQHRIHGLGLLLDFEPPWEGAVKDALRYPQRAPEAALDQFVQFWARRGEPAAPLTAVEAKRRALEALEQNRRMNIRLHPDLIAARDLFTRNVLVMPDGPDTPPFTAADFDFLANNGQQPEALKREERRFGYRARTADGKEIRILRGPDDW